MKLLTHNLLTSRNIANVKEGYPLRIEVRRLLNFLDILLVSYSFDRLFAFKITYFKVAKLSRFITQTDRI